MSIKYIFEGFSDDTFGEVNNAWYDDDSATRSIRRFTVKRPSGEGVLITGKYNNSGMWHIGMSILDEDQPLNKDDWQIYFEPNEESAYRNRLIVNAPDDADVEFISNKETNYEI